MPVLELSRPARRSLAALLRGDRRQADRARTVLRALRAGRPLPGARRLSGSRAGQTRVAVGKLRILYAAAGDHVHVLAIGYRRDIYGLGSGISN